MTVAHQTETRPHPDRGPAGLPRPVEATLAALALAAASPLLALAAAAVAATSRGGALFRQTRIGRGGRPFTLLKLRTMRAADPGRPAGPLVTAAGDPRVTPVGRLLRATKIDELPALWNVVRGEMALVGPRPEVPDLVDADDPRWRAVLAARPGLTDPVTLRLRDEEGLLARLAGPGAGDGAADAERERFYRERLQPWKLAGYLDYLVRRSWASDLGVLALTAWRIVRPAPPPGREEIDAAAEFAPPAAAPPEEGGPGG